MNINNVFAKLRYIFDYNDLKMTEIFGIADLKISEEQVRNWLRKEEDPLFAELNDPALAVFLDGLIIEKRGNKDGPVRVPEKHLTNNIIFRKLKIALNLKADDVLEILKAEGILISKNELSAFFRRSDHKHYRQCQDQILRNFLNGLQGKYRS